MPASLSRHARYARSVANKTANRLVREQAAYQMALNLIHRRVRQREAELARELLPDEFDDLCEQLSFDNLVQFIQSLGVPACSK